MPVPLNKRAMYRAGHAMYRAEHRLIYTADMSFLFDHMPLWGVFLLTTGLVLLGFEIGFKIGDYIRKKDTSDDHAKHGSIGTITQSTLALVAFMLAFTFGAASERFNDRRVLIVKEADAISTAYLRMDFLPDAAARTEVKSLLREYLAMRLEPVKNGREVDKLASEAEKLQDKIWSRTTGVVRVSLDSDIGALLIESLNEMFDLQSDRMVAFHARLPSTVWDCLSLMIFVGVAATGYQCGVTRSRVMPVTITLVIAFGVIVMLIADLDRPLQGTLRVSREPLIDLNRRLNSPPLTAPEAQQH